MSVNSACWLYELDKKEKSMKLLVKFRTDFATVESSQSCACFVGNSTILTGGEDGVVRVWGLNREPTAAEKAVGTAAALDCSAAASSTKPNHDAPAMSPQLPKVGNAVVSDTSNTLVTLAREYKAHTKRIRDLHVDASHRNLVVSSSEDQTCHLWRLTEDTALYQFSKDDALDIAFDMLKSKPPAGPRKHQFRCARFANNGRRLYTVLTPARGDSILVKWKPETIAQTSEAQWRWVVESVAIAGDKPVASLCVSHDDDFVCTAAVSGDIKVFRTENLQPYKKISTEQHSFAITGMSFAFTNGGDAVTATGSKAAKKKDQVFHLVSGGADKNLLRHDIYFEGGEIISGGAAFVGGVQALIGGAMRLVLGSIMASTLLFTLLLFIHAKEAMLMDRPLGGFDVSILYLWLCVDVDS